MKKATVQDVMTKKVVFVREEAPFKEIARLMSEDRISGLPVLDVDDRLAGIVSEGDLLAAEGDDLTAKDLMSTDVISVAPEEPIESAARQILINGVKRLPVIDLDEHVLGIVSRTDLLRPFLREDHAIRQEIIEDLLLETMWIDPSTIDVKVGSGVVTLLGTVETKSTKEVLLELVHRVTGVIGVKDRLSYRSDDGNTRAPTRPSFSFGREGLTRVK